MNFFLLNCYQNNIAFDKIAKLKKRKQRFEIFIFRNFKVRELNLK